MIKVERKPCINCWDIEKEWELDPLDMPFVECAENDSYISFDCSHKHLKELEEYRFDWQNYPQRVEKIDAQIALWHKLRDEAGFEETDEVLIYISW